MTGLPTVVVVSALTLLAACAPPAATNGGDTAVSVDRASALNECRSRAAIEISPAGGGGRGMAGYSDYDQAVAQCLRNKKKAANR